MKRLFFTLLGLSVLFSAPVGAEVYVTIVQGLGGLPEYDGKFTDQRTRITEATYSQTPEEQVTVFSGEEASRDSLLAHFTSLTEMMNDNDRAVIYLIGHGSFDGEQYKFNIPGPDITNADLDEILENLPGDNHFLVNTSSTSGAILETLEDNGSTIVITATRNGNERNATEFGAFFAEALSSEEADINKNNNLSLQEAFDYAERKVAEFFDSSGKLATEHPQIRGEGAAQITLARLNPVEITSSIPEITPLLERRITIDAQIEDLQLNRSDYSNAEYTQLLRELILESASVTEQIEALSEAEGAVD